MFMEVDARCIQGEFNYDDGQRSMPRMEDVADRENFYLRKIILEESDILIA